MLLKLCALNCAGVTMHSGVLGYIAYNYVIEYEKRAHLEQTSETEILLKACRPVYLLYL